MKKLSALGVAAAMLFPSLSYADDCTPNNITLDSQTLIDTFQADHGPCDTVAGSLTIEDNPDITNLRGIDQLVSVNNNLRIRDLPTLVDLDDLSALGGTIGRIAILRNAELLNLAGLSGVQGVNGELNITDNPKLIDVDGLSGLSTLGGRLVLNRNNSLQSIDGLVSISEVNGNLDVRNHPQLTTVRGLYNVLAVHGTLRVDRNAILNDCDGIFRLVDERDDAAPGPNLTPGPGDPPDVENGVVLARNGDGSSCESIAQIIGAGPLEWNTASGDWASAASWYPNRVPTSTDNPYIRNGGSASAGASAGSIQAMNLTVGDVSLGGDGSFSSVSVDVILDGSLLAASGTVDAFSMASRRVTGAINLTDTSAVTAVGALQLGRISALATVGDSIGGVLRATGTGILSSVQALSVGGDVDVGMLSSWADTGGVSGIVQRSTFRPQASLVATDVASLGIGGSLNIGVVAAAETTDLVTRGTHTANGDATLQNVVSSVGAAVRVGVVDKNAAFSGGNPVDRPNAQAVGGLSLQNSSLASASVEVGIVATDHVGSAQGALSLNPSFIATGNLAIGAGGSLTMDIEGETRASAGNLAESGLYSAIDAGSVILAGPVYASFAYIPEDGEYDYDLVSAGSIVLETGYTLTVQNLPAGFEVTAFDVQPAAGGSVLRLSISSGGVVDPNEPSGSGGSVPVPVMGAWQMLLLVLMVTGVVARRIRQ